MGQVQPTFANAQFEKDGYTLESSHVFGSGVIATAISNEVMAYDVAHMSTKVLADKILNKSGQGKRIIYVSGTHYEMGYLIGYKFHSQVEALCTVYLRHIVPQFVSESFDNSMRKAPYLYQTAYETLLQVLVDIIVQGSFDSFNRSKSHGDIQPRLVEELEGIVAGCGAVYTMTSVTMKRIVAVNYGLDYLTCEMFSGRLLQRLQKAWNKSPPALRKFMPTLKQEYLCVPDMCNVAMLWGPATKSKEDVFLARDFQFNNARVWHRKSTIIIRNPTDYAAHLSVAIPGMIGHVTSVNQYGVAMGINLVRSCATSPDRVGSGSMFILRDLAERAHTSVEAEHLLKTEHVIGTPWIYYALDESGDARVFETIARRYDRSISKKWVSNEKVRRKMPSTKALGEWSQDSQGTGVWTRTGKPPASEKELTQWNRKLLSALKVDTAEISKWQPGQYMFGRWESEKRFVAKVGHMYFAPWRYMGKGAVFVSNAYLNVGPRLTQMYHLANDSAVMATGNQWRYDKMVHMVKENWGNIDFDYCKQLVEFLSPWNQPHYPQNEKRRRDDELHEIIDNMLSSSSEMDEGMQDDYSTHDHDKHQDSAIPIAGAMCVVDVKRRVLSVKTGFWGTDYYTVDLMNYI